MIFALLFTLLWVPENDIRYVMLLCYVIKLNPPLKLLSVDLTETFSDSEDEVEMSYVFKPDTQKKVANLQKLLHLVHQKKTRPIIADDIGHDIRSS